jgi:hypothetical protein
MITIATGNPISMPKVLAMNDLRAMAFPFC